MKKGTPVLLCGLAAMAVTVILYLVVVGSGLWGVIHFISLLGVLVAEAVTTGYIYSANGSPRKIGAAAFSAVMIPFAVILSVVYIVNFPEGYGTYLGWYFAATIVVNAICFVLSSFDSRKKEENDSLQAAKSNMLMLRKLVKVVLAEPNAQPYQAKLEALEEKLHFSNDGVIGPDDAQIRQLLLQLQEKVRNQEGAACEEILAKLDLMADQRKIMTSRNV